MKQSRLSTILSISAMVVALYCEATPAGRFVDNDDGSVQDATTGLVWQQADDGGLMPWTDAGPYCDKLSLAGHEDWRLPRVDELRTIADYTRYMPALDPVFEGHAETYWASEPYFNYQDFFMGVYFGTGGIDGAESSRPLHVRCVREGPFWSLDTSKHLVVDSATTVKDTYRHLVWQRGDEINMTRGYLWDGARDYCERLETGGYSDWRMPSIEELQTIIDYTRRLSPIWNTDMFPAAPRMGWWFWSSTDYAEDPDEAWTVNFGRGYIYPSSKSGDYHLRCVRGGAPEPVGTLAITKTGDGTGTVTSKPPGIQCGDDCMEEFTAGRKIGLHAKPGPGWQFDGWSGDACSGARGECEVTITGNMTVAAEFSRRMHALSGIITGADGAPMESVKVSLTGPASGEVTTASDGIYRFFDLPEGVYTITPSKPLYSFTPASRMINVRRANVKGKNFKGVAGSDGTEAGESVTVTEDEDGDDNSQEPPQSTDSDAEDALSGDSSPRRDAYGTSGSPLFTPRATTEAFSYLRDWIQAIETSHLSTDTIELVIDKWKGGLGLQDVYILLA